MEWTWLAPRALGCRWQNALKEEDPNFCSVCHFFPSAALAMLNEQLSCAMNIRSVFTRTGLALKHALLLTIILFNSLGWSNGWARSPFTDAPKPARQPESARPNSTQPPSKKRSPFANGPSPASRPHRPASVQKAPSGRSLFPDTPEWPSPGSAPTASAGPDQIVPLGARVTLDGSRSSDGAGSSRTLTYTWSFSSKPPGSRAALSEAGDAAPTFLADKVGKFVLELVVTDKHETVSQSDEVVVTSSGQPSNSGRPQAPNFNSPLEASPPPADTTPQAPAHTPTPVPTNSTTPPPPTTSEPTPDNISGPKTNIPPFINTPKPVSTPEVQQDGRRILGDQEARTGIYRYVGYLMTSQGGETKGWGTATLIGPRHILTAGHVCVELDKLKKAYGPTVFVLPDGRRSIVGQIEIDAGWKNPAFDIAVCTLTEELGAKGHAYWNGFDKERFGSEIHLTGYDADMALKGTTGLIPQLIDRTGVVERCNQNTKKYGAPLAVLSGAVMFYAAAEGKLSPTGGGLLYGGSALFGGYQLLKNAVFDANGWQASIVAEPGASGGPIWVEDGANQIVIGVQSAMTVLKSEMRKSGLGREWEPAGVVGSRITAGPCLNMIKNHIGGHGTPPSDDDYRLVFMAYPPGTIHDDGQKSMFGHAFVGFAKNGVFTAVKGFGPDNDSDMFTPDFSSRLTDNTNYVSKATIRFEYKVDIVTYERCLAVTKSVYVGGLNDCVTYAATIADIANINRPGPQDGVLKPMTYVNGLINRNP